MVKAQIEDDPTPPMPFDMVEKMMPMYPLIAIMGWMFVLISFLVGLFVLAPAFGDFFGAVKATRESTQSYVSSNVLIHFTETWLPEFKFLGLGLGLMAITMALGTIAKRLRKMGKVITYYMPEDIRPAFPEIPKIVKLFQASAMMGIMILMLTFVLGLFYAFGDVSTYWDATIQTLNLSTVNKNVVSIKHWLGPLRMMGMSFLFIAITIALIVITDTLKTQSKIVNEFKSKASSR